MVQYAGTWRGLFQTSSSTICWIAPTWWKSSASASSLPAPETNTKAFAHFTRKKTPSFTVSPSKGFFHCFGCGAHGSALGFLMQHDRLDFPRDRRGAGRPLRPGGTSQRPLTTLGQRTLRPAACRGASLRGAAQEPLGGQGISPGPRPERNHCARLRARLFAQERQPAGAFRTNRRRPAPACLRPDCA